ncbi:MAG: hypothetical protein QXL89_01675 [Nitrososphaeria archaeon]
MKDKEEKEKIKLILDRGGVKKHIFLPSNIEIWSVVGEEGDYLVNDNPLFCTCKDFYYLCLIKKRKKMCYHLKALLLAKKKGKYTVYHFTDEEIGLFSKLVFNSLK